MIRFKYNTIKFTLVCYLSQLCDLYENDSIFDKFECCLSGDGGRVATGSYRLVVKQCTYFAAIIIQSCPVLCMAQLVNISVISAICFECLVVLKGAQKQQHWRPAKTP